MQEVKYLIVGGGAAGTGAAETIRSQDKESTIAIISDEPHRFYSRILLSKPNFFLEKIPFAQVWLKTEEWYRQNNIVFWGGKKAVGLDPHAKTVSLDDGTAIRYGKLLLAIGGSARPWGIPGSQKQGIFYLRTLDDAKAIIHAVKGARRGVAIGGGFIGFEMCEMMCLAGMETTILIREPYFWANLLDETSGQMIEASLAKNGITISRNAQAREVLGNERVEELLLSDGKKISCDIAVVGIGLTCPFDWIGAAGVMVDRAIITNEYLETNVRDVWAAGDAAEFNDLVTGERIQLGNWVNAQMQGKAAARNMMGKKEAFRMVSFYTTQGFDLKIAFVGNVRPAPDHNVISRGSKEIASYARLISKNGKLIGATLINRTQELGAIAKLIERGVDVSDKQNQLSDPNVNLNALLSQIA